MGVSSMGRLVRVGTIAQFSAWVGCVLVRLIGDEVSGIESFGTPGSDRWGTPGGAAVGGGVVATVWSGGAI